MMLSNSERTEVASPSSCCVDSRWAQRLLLERLPWNWLWASVEAMVDTMSTVRVAIISRMSLCMVFVE